MEAHTLECQVSAQEFVAALGVLTDALLMKVRTCNKCYARLSFLNCDLLYSWLFSCVKDKKCAFYPVIIDSFEEYRYVLLHLW